jgi:hypothetical protein
MHFLKSSVALLAALGYLSSGVFSAPIKFSQSSLADDPVPGSVCDPNFQTDRCIGTKIGLCYYNVWIVTPCGGNRICTGEPGGVWCESPSNMNMITPSPTLIKNAGVVRILYSSRYFLFHFMDVKN